MRKLVILDTNFLLIPGQFGVDVFSELQRVCGFSYQVCVLDKTLGEMEKLASGESVSLKDRRAAKLGLQLLRAKSVSIVGSGEYGERKVFKSTDKAILDFAAAKNRSEPGSAVVATQDRKLQGSLAAKGVAVIVLRQKKYLRFHSQGA